jgi:endo-1,4-beta-D-glucanase Y
VTLVALTLLVALAAPPAPWPLYDRYLATFVTADGRVREPSAGDRTTSEGQAYGMFFALVANDRPTFERLLRWTRDNLAGGDLERHLPSWHWGRDARGWHVLDRSCASDADLWMAYATLEAGRLWKEPAYTRLGTALLARITSTEIRTLPGLGAMVLPGPVGFELTPGRRWRLNPSYLPLQLFRRFASAGVPGPWADLPAATVRLVREVSPRGFAPDWAGYDAQAGFGPDPVKGPIGSYDAIRVYLWAGMLPDEEPLRGPLLAALGGPARWLADRGTVPERVDVASGADRGQHAPPGFLAVLLPAAQARGDQALTARLEAGLAGQLRDGLYGAPATYYDQNLVLFARGFAEGRFRFAADGALRTAWHSN